MAPALTPHRRASIGRSPVLAIVELAILAFFHGAAFPLVVRPYLVAAPRRAARSHTAASQYCHFPGDSGQSDGSCERSMVLGRPGADRGQQRRRNILDTTRARLARLVVEQRLELGIGLGCAALELLVIHMPLVGV